MEMDQLIEATIEDPSREPELFALLLEATLYVHAPKKNLGDRLSIVQFKTPQGVLAIPVFTDRKKADFAGRGNVRVVALQGRQLFSATIGANIVINPNDAWCILYPEEIRALLEGRQLGRTPEDIQVTKELKLRPVKAPCVELLKLIEDSLSTIEPALDAWLAEADDVGGASNTRYVVVIASETPHHERIARSLTLALSDLGRSFDKNLDITFIEPGEVHKAWLEGNSGCLIYRRAWLPSIRSGISGNA
jgi:hypothetical protein